MTTEAKILLRLCAMVSIAEADAQASRRMAFMPPHPDDSIRQFQAQAAERGDGQRTALIAAIAETDWPVELVASLASGHEYEKAAGFIVRSAKQIERERQQRFLRERIAAERGEEFCANCGKPSDGTYCDLNCLQQHNAAAISGSDYSLEGWVVQHLA